MTGHLYRFQPGPSCWRSDFRAVTAHSSSSSTTSSSKLADRWQRRIRDRWRQRSTPDRSGFTLIELLIVITIIGILVAIAFPSILENRKSANETSAVASLKAINWAEVQYRAKYSNYGMISDLATAGLVDPALGQATNSGTFRSSYYFESLTVPPGGTQYFIVGLPASSTGGDFVYYTDEAGTVFEAALKNNPVIPTTDSSGRTPAGFEPIGN